MIKPQKFQARLSDRQDYNQRYSQYHFELIEPLTLENLAGQYLMLQIDEKTARAYSMSDRPDMNTSFELLVDHAPAGVGTQFLRQLAFGASVQVIAPLGQFVVKEDPEVEQLIFVTSGSGIAPIKSMITDLLQIKNDKRAVTLFWGMRHDSELFWLDFFSDLQKSFPQFTFVPVISQPSANWQLSIGHVTDYLQQLEKVDKAQFYLCGNPQMVESVKQILTTKNVPAERIIVEQFNT
ncbi:MAG: FAD-binding oxidoreductase [bacterium]|nr:FAD-binding oxidoreductase [bacterium]